MLSLMLWPDVIDLKYFYSTPAGEMVLASLRARIRRLWKAMRGETVLGLGFCPPLLQPLLGEADAVYAGMPAQQGVIHWPPGELNRTFLSDEAELPFADNSVSRVILLHALENSEQVRPLIKEIWRVLSPTGRVIVIVPNRVGIWARAPRSPFAHGRPYTMQQLHDLLFDQLLTPLRSEHAIFFWPASSNFMLKVAKFMERVGRFFWPRLGGLIIMEAEKQIYAPTRGLRAPISVRRNPVTVPAKPAMGQALSQE